MRLCRKDRVGLTAITLSFGVRLPSPSLAGFLTGLANVELREPLGSGGSDGPVAAAFYGAEPIGVQGINGSGRGFGGEPSGFFPGG